MGPAARAVQWDRRSRPETGSAGALRSLGSSSVLRQLPGGEPAETCAAYSGAWAVPDAGSSVPGTGSASPKGAARPHSPAVAARVAVGTAAGRRLGFWIHAAEVSPPANIRQAPIRTARWNASREDDSIAAPTLERSEGGSFSASS